MDVCHAYSRAKDAGVLKTPRQIIAAKRANAILRACSKIGIIALVDEATGYQEVRKKDELAKILKDWIEQEKYRKWTSTFPLAFYELMFKLKGWNTLNPKLSRPAINDIVSVI